MRGFAHILEKIKGLEKRVQTRSGGVFFFFLNAVFGTGWGREDWGGGGTPLDKATFGGDESGSDLHLVDLIAAKTTHITGGPEANSGPDRLG